MRLCIYVYNAINFRRFSRRFLLLTRGQEVMVRSHPFRVRRHTGKLSTRGRPVQPDRVHETQLVRVNRFHVDKTVFDDRRPGLVSPYGPVQIALKTRAGRSVWPNGRMVVCFVQRSRTKINSSLKIFQIFYSTVNIAAKRKNRKSRKSQ